MIDKRKVQAVVLAGGLGTRLSPLTDTKPKPLVKILDTPVISSVLENAKSAGADEITLSVCYKGEMIKEETKNIEGNISAVTEVTPLGTAGAVKNCIKNGYDVYLVLSGDALFDYDLEAVIEYHFEKQNDVTVVSAVCENPTEYGCIISGEDGKIAAFAEKPPWKRVKTNLVNTGIYLLSPRAVGEIPDNTVYDFAKNLFPKLMESGFVMRHICAEGRWCDVGTPDEYVKANKMAAKGFYSCIKNNGFKPSELRDRGIYALDGIYASETVKFGKNVSITDSSVLCENVFVGDNCDVSGSVVGKNTQIGKGSSISCAIVSDNCRIGENCVISKGCVLGDGVVVHEGTVLKSGSRIKPFSVLSGKDEQNVEFVKNRCVFCDDGKVVFSGADIFTRVYNFALCCGKAFDIKNMGHMNVGIMSDDISAGEIAAIASALCRDGNVIYDLGKGDETLFRYASFVLPLDFSLYASRNGDGHVVYILDENGKEPDDATERKILKYYNNPDDSFENKPTLSGNAVKVPVKQMYNSFVSAVVKNLVKGGNNVFPVSFKGGNDFRCNVMKSLYENMEFAFSAKGKDVLTVTFSPYFSVVQNGTEIDKNHAAAIVVKNLDVTKVSNIDLPENSPFILYKLLKENKGTDIPGTPVEFAVSKLALYDECVLFALLFSVLNLRAVTLSEALAEIEEFCVFDDEYFCTENRASAMERLRGLYVASDKNSGDGILLHLPGGTVRVIPKRKDGFRIISEAVSMEAAKEISFKIGEAIKGS